MDIGGSLSKLVYFEPTDDDVSDSSTTSTVHRYLTNNRVYGSTGHRDEHLQLDNIVIGGRVGSLHFIRFPTSEMNNFLELAREKGMASMASTVCATGGGAFKFESQFYDELKLRLHKFDELDSLLRGMEFVEAVKGDEVFYLKDPKGECEKVGFDFSDPYPFLVSAYQ